MAGEKSILCPTIERRTEVVKQLMDELAGIASTKTEVDELKGLIPQLPLVDLGHVASMMIALKISAMDAMASVDEVIDLTQSTIDLKTS